MSSSLPDITPTFFRVQIKSEFSWAPPETVTLQSRWLDDVLEELAHNRNLNLSRVLQVEFQQVHNGNWTRIQGRDLQEAIGRVSQVTTGGGNNE